MMITAESFQRLSFLKECLAGIQIPGVSDPEVQPAAEDFLKGRIADLEQDLFGQIENAAGQGDIFSETQVISVAFSIPASSEIDKEEWIHG